VGAVDYQFSRNMSIGVMGTYGKVTAPYYDYSSATEVPSFTGSLENWSILLNVMSFMPTYNNSIEPYLRTAIGINNWTQSYVDPAGNKAADIPDPSQLAYQVSLGARFNLSKGAGFYIEGGYGKYILTGGLTLKF
jgi:predicted porin